MTHWIEMLKAPGELIVMYDRNKLPNDQRYDIPQKFLDAMTVRKEVFVEEQGVGLAEELDDDDLRSTHFITYASAGGFYRRPGARALEYLDANNMNLTQAERRTPTAFTMPVGNIRIVPWPHLKDPPYKVQTFYNLDKTEMEKLYDGKEAYIKLGRLCVIAEHRGRNFGM